MGGRHPDIGDDRPTLQTGVRYDDPGEEGAGVEIVVRCAMHGYPDDAKNVRKGETGEYERHGEGGDPERVPLLTKEEESHLSLLAAQDDAVGDQAFWGVVVEPAVLHHGDDGDDEQAAL